MHTCKISKYVMHSNAMYISISLEKKDRCIKC
jgi:hypothetical protein